MECVMDCCHHRLQLSSKYGSGISEALFAVLQNVRLVSQY